MIMNKIKEEILKIIETVSLTKHPDDIAFISKSLDFYAQQVRNEVLEECIEVLDRAKKAGASSTLGMAQKIISQLRNKDLACEKHSRILIGKDRCVDCEKEKKLNEN